MSKEEKLYKYGIKCSSLFSSFGKWIIDEVKKNNIKKIYFFTREGEFFKEIVDKLNNAGIKTYVLEVSRVSTFFPSLREISIEELMRIWNQYKCQSINSLFKSLGIQTTDYLKYFKKYNINEFTEINEPFSNKKIKSLFLDKEFKNKLLEEQKKRKIEFYKYIKKKDLDISEEKIAIVDIGWRGTIQDNICYLLPNTKLYGYYFGLIDFINEQPKNAYKFGFVNRYKGGYKYIKNFPPFEMICNSPNGSTICYENGKAVRKKDDIENASYYGYSCYFQKGVLDNVLGRYDDNLVIKTLANIAYNPNFYISECYVNLKHNEEFGLGKYINFNVKITYFQCLMSLISNNERNKLKQILYKSSWPQGIIKYNKLDILNYYILKKHFNKNDCKLINENV